MTPARALSTSLLEALLALSGCGADDAPEPVAQAAAPAPAAIAAEGDGGITAAELGDASTAAAGEDGETVTPGGDVAPDAAAPEAPEGEGVGGAASCVGAEEPPTVATAPAAVTATICLVNAERAARGAPVLTRHPKLDQAARVHAKAMVAEQFFGHVGRDGSTVTSRVKQTGYLKGLWNIGENLAWGSGGLSTPRAIVTGWLNSPGHRRNMLNPSFRHVGLALEIGTPRATANSGATYVNEFGRVRSAR